ncbi:hypothetical protein B4168_2475 [Anoxybacillus flavithermus]|nr:hypothetical protein B4168_2475 [Anoxybacillus flavithermus]OAO85305.1 hypothetical protein GT23_2996 [Parageobacillus thermoglucosidasius]
MNYAKILSNYSLSAWWRKLVQRVPPSFFCKARRQFREMDAFFQN